MIEHLLIAIVVLLTLNLALNVSTWSRDSAVCNRLAFWARGLRKRAKRRVLRYRRGRNGRKRI